MVVHASTAKEIERTILLTILTSHRALAVSSSRLLFCLTVFSPRARRRKSYNSEKGIRKRRRTIPPRHSHVLVSIVPMACVSAQQQWEAASVQAQHQAPHKRTHAPPSSQSSSREFPPPSFAPRSRAQTQTCWTAAPQMLAGPARA